MHNDVRDSGAHKAFAYFGDGVDAASPFLKWRAAMGAYKRVRRPRSVAVAVAVTMAAGSIPLPWSSASADGSAPARTTVADVSAVVSGENIVVTGTATFVEFPTYIAEDPAGDSMVPLQGTDLTWAAIEREPGTDALTFSLGLRDMPLTGGAVGYVYTWPLGVNGESTGLMLQASVGMVDCVTGDARPGRVFRLVEHGFDEVAPLQGSFAHNKITFDDVPLDLIGAAGGSRITTAGEPVVTTAGVAGCSYLSNSMGDSMAASLYIVPEMMVHAGIAPMGELGSGAALDDAVLVSGNGEQFSLMLSRPSTAGEYEVVVQACYGASRCAVETLVMSVPEATS